LTGERVTRRLAAILAADVVGYSRLMGRDEHGTLTRLKAHRTERLEPVLARHGGRLVKLTGDGALVEFPSAVDALGAAIEFQQSMAEVDRDQPEDTRIVFRIGLHLGDLIVDGDDLYGDGVNVAARLEAEAPAGGIVISGDVHNAVTGRLKANFDDLGTLSLKNIERPVQAFGVKWDATDWKVSTSAIAAPPVATTPTADAPLTLPDKPSIAVLPFQNMSGDPEQEYFVDGLVEDIITALSRTKSLFVIARNSSFSYKGKSPDIRLVGRELGVRYVLEGSVRKAGDRIRITGQLIDATNGTHIWADRFDGALKDIFELQDQVTLSIVAAIQPELRQAEFARVRRKPVENLDAYDWYLRGLAHLNTRAREAFTEALKCFQTATGLDPTYGAAWGMSAYCIGLRSIAGWSTDEAEDAKEVRRMVPIAVTNGRDDPAALWAAGHAVAWIGRDVDTAASLIARSLELDPGNASAWASSSYFHSWLGHPEKAVEHGERGLRLNPRDPMNFAGLTAVALGYQLMGRYADAIEAVERSLRDYPETMAALRIGATSYALAGRLEEARALGRRVLARDPTYSCSKHRALVPFKRTEDIELGLKGLRLAGIPE